MDSKEAAPERGIDQSDVLEKYKAAGAIADQAMDVLRKAAFSGMSVRKMCQLGDAVIEKAAAAVYSKAKTDTGEKLEKGVAFPTCVCVNNCAAHFCPIETDPEAGVELTSGDVITVQVGAHIDGYSALTSQTLVVRASKEDDNVVPLEGKKADAVMAAYTAAEAVLRLMRPGKTNEEVSDVIGRVAEIYGVQALEGVLSHQMKRYVIDGSKVIVNKQTLECRADRKEFEPYEVFNLDVVMSTGDGKAIERDTRETIYKRQVDVDYKLKMKTSRQVFSEINKSYPTMPFTLRALSDPKRSRMAMTEMLKHQLVTSYPVLYEKDDAIVARCSLTVLITPNQTMTVSKSQMPKLNCNIEMKDEEIAALLATSMDKKKKKKKKAVVEENGEREDAMET
eukprot:GFKZ01006769.1.p1 GENE.GFKZ01006769.1~~GFKZ01006769.1.p1  ORF type:complete len:462 (+),score=81.10 GFKZ01006769.1:206-1387(+)